MGLAEDYRAAWLAGFDGEMTRVSPEGYKMTITPQPWIPVGERLPEEEEEVLACWVPRKDGMACAVIRNLNGKVCWTPADQWTECDPPKWWMPLPEPPEVK